MGNKPLPLFDDEIESTISNNEADIIFYYKNESRKIVPCTDKELNQKARVRLDFIKATFHNLPSVYTDNWKNVKLYSPKMNAEKATGLLINVNDGVYDINNSLNHMTGKEWTKFTCSWFIFNALPSDLKEEREITNDTESHPATFSPTMTSEFIKFFTKEGQIVLDPFAGIGSTLVACRRTNRIGYGIELNPKYFEIVKLRVPKFSEFIFNCDSRNLRQLNLPTINYSISSPPYWNVLNRSTDGFKKNREENGLDVSYSNSEKDLGNIDDYNVFINELSKIYLDLYDLMADGSYLSIIVKNVKKGGKLYPLAWDLAHKLSEKYTLKDERIWIQDKIGLSPFGYPHTWASNIIHHYCLNFKKEK